jgi:hypothetical protein
MENDVVRDEYIDNIQILGELDYHQEWTVSSQAPEIC